MAAGSGEADEGSGVRRVVGTTGTMGGIEKAGEMGGREERDGVGAEEGIAEGWGGGFEGVGDTEG